MENREHAHSEYVELGLALRHYSALRFAIFTVFIAILGGLMIMSSDISPTRQFLTLATRVGGLLITGAFWIFEYRLETYMKHFEQRVAELEKSLGYNIYSGRHKSGSRWLRTPIAIQIIFLAVALFWVLSFFA